MIRSRYGDVPIVFMPEAVAGNASAHLADHLLFYRKVLTMAEGNSRGDALGVIPTDRNRQTSRTTLMLATNAIHYSENMMTYPGADRKPIDELKNQMEKQLLGWEKVIKYDENDPHAKVQYKWTAKHSAGNDDLAVCILMLAYWSTVFYENPMYINWIAQNVTPHGGGSNNNNSNGGPPVAHVPDQPQRRGAIPTASSQAVMNHLHSTNAKFSRPAPMGLGAPPDALKRRSELAVASNNLPGKGSKRMHK